jgi:hypothetical protein
MRRLLPLAALALCLAAPAARADNEWVLEGATIGGVSVTGVFTTNVYNYLETWDITESGGSNIEYSSVLPDNSASFSGTSTFTVTDGAGDFLGLSFAAIFDGNTNPDAITTGGEIYGQTSLSGATGDAVLPEPASIALLGSALAALAGLRRRRG